MNEIQKEVLLRHTRDLMNDVMVTERLLADMFQRKIFDQEMIEMIRVQPTPHEKVHKMLQLLPKRGPDAFNNFVSVLEEGYPWLANRLKDTLREEMEISASALGELNRQDTMLPQVNKDQVLSPRAPPPAMDADIKARVGTFVHKQFGHVRRVSNSDRRDIQKWIGEWMQLERKQMQAKYNHAIEDIDENILQHPDVLARLHELHERLQQLDKSRCQSAETEDTETGSQCEISFETIEEEINSLMVKNKKMETQLRQSYELFGDEQQKKTLPNHIRELSRNLRQAEKDAMAEKQKIEKMLVELYAGSTEINKLQQQIKYKEQEISDLQYRFQTLIEANSKLEDTISRLERDKLVHMQKEKTLEELRQTKGDLEMLMKILRDENQELKKQLNNRILQRGRRMTNVSISNLSPRQMKTTKQLKKRPNFHN